MKKIMISLVTIVIVTVSTIGSAYGKEFYKTWNEMDLQRKADFFSGLMIGVQAMGLHTNIPREVVPHGKIQELFNSVAEDGECHLKNFDTIYSKRININPSILFYSSFQLCKGNITESQFLKIVKESSK